VVGGAWRGGLGARRWASGAMLWARAVEQVEARWIRTKDGVDLSDAEERAGFSRYVGRL
jgi:hypothetical protein